MKSYIRFGVMIATSIIVMFILMYFNTFEWGHIFFSETRVYMAILMGAVMAIVMMGFMFKMHKKKLVNISIFIGSFIVIILMVFLVRSQITVGDVSYMRAMIPHHSIAILTSERAKIKDPRVKDLANSIIEAQVSEIEEMKMLIKDLEDKK
jgi:uncharacterized protein (DUF305 family)